MNAFQTWVPGLELYAGESQQDRLCRFVRTLNGVSLDVRPNVLEALIRRNVDPAALRSWEWLTDCATSALGILAAACGTVDAARRVHILLATPSVNRTSIAWTLQIGRELGRLRTYKPGDPLPKASNLGMYAHGAHVEWTLSEPDPATGIADHGGGGRSRNAIEVGHGDIRWSSGHPLTEIFDFAPVLPASQDAAPENDSPNRGDATS